jgi:integrase
VLEPHQVNAMLEAADRLDRKEAGITAPVLAVVELRTRGLTYQQIADELAIGVSTAHHRYARYEHAGEPIAFFRIWVRALCAIGLRIDEACHARRRDVDLVAMCLRVGHAKTAAGVRDVQLTPDTAADLRSYLAMTAERPVDGPLLPTRTGTFTNRTNAAKRVIAPLVTQTNIVLGERNEPALRDGVTAHALRKTFFTFLHEAGAPPRWVADQGGHSDPSTSLRIYTESLRGRERGHHGEAFDAMLDAATSPRRRRDREGEQHPSLFDDDEPTATER